MVRYLKGFLVTLICFSCIISLVSCKGGIKTDEAKSFISDFFDAVEAAEYDRAMTFLHPERPTELEPFFQGIENETGVDFQQGIEVERYTNFRYAYYDSTVDGSAYESTIRTDVGGHTVIFTVEIVQNDNGYGIYNLDVDT